MRRAIVVLFVAGIAAAAPRVKVTSYAAKYYGRHTASGMWLTPRDLIVAVNRDSLYGRLLLLWSHDRSGAFSVPVIAADKFNRKKFAAPYVKIDATARVMHALGLLHTAWIDSVTTIQTQR